MKNFVSVRTLMYGTALAAGMLGLFTGVSMLQKAIAQVAMVEAPMFEVDPLWPKPLPNEGLLGMTIGVSIDAQDNVWIVHRGAATLNNNEKGADAQSAGRDLLPFGTAGDRVQPGRRRDPRLGRPGRGL